jgi:hypothetical protein
VTATVWRYTYGGHTKHALTDLTYMRSACGIWVWETCDWMGDGSTAERERCEQLRECRRCAAKVGA